MALRIRFQYEANFNLGYSIERLADGLFFDFLNATFVANPTQFTAPLPEDTGNFAGRYKVTLDPTPETQFADGDYCVTVHLTGENDQVVAELGTTMHGGDDATYFAPGFGGNYTITPTPNPSPPVAS